MTAFPNLLSAIGNTPLVFLEKYSKEYGANIFVKLENLNPGGSIKDRVALGMIQGALARGDIKEGGTVIEPTSGNTGIGLALVNRFFNLRTVLVMPASMSIERRKLLAAYGAELVLTPAGEGMGGAVEKALELLASTPNSYMPNQFENPDCPLVHYKTTGPEIARTMKELALNPDIFLAGVGTGGTVSGIGKYLKEVYSHVQIIGIEPSESAVIQGKPKGVHGIQGIGAGFIPKTFYKEYVDDLYSVSTDDAKKAARELFRDEGVSAGISAGANIFGAIQYAKQNQGKNIITVIPDGVDKYLSTDLLDA